MAKLEGKLLTRAEVDELQAGQQIRIVWSGGNGPHIYTVFRDKWGTIYAEFKGVKHCLDYVGQFPLTQVQLV